MIALPLKPQAACATLLWEGRTDAALKTLSDSLVTEIFKALGLSENGAARRTFGPLFLKATRRLSEIGLTFDRLCAEEGFPNAAEWALAMWCRGVRARGVEHVPSRGPLLVVSNHPGTYDALAIAAHLRRSDIRIFSSDIPFLKYLPHARSHFFFVDLDPQTRARATRAGIRHLRGGGTVLLYGSGQIDPDPALSEDAIHDIDLWSRSIELFMRLVPETKVLLSIVSQAVSRGWSRSPITWLRREAVDKRRLVEFGQVIQQLLFPGSLYLSPRLSFAPAITAAAFDLKGNRGEVLSSLIARGKELLSEHVAVFGRS